MDSKVRETLELRVRLERIRRRLKQSELVALVGVSQADGANWSWTRSWSRHARAAFFLLWILRRLEMYGSPQYRRGTSGISALPLPQVFSARMRRC
jgi:hypothetical protein